MSFVFSLFIYDFDCLICRIKSLPNRWKLKTNKKYNMQIQNLATMSWMEFNETPALGR